MSVCWHGNDPLLTSCSLLSRVRVSGGAVNLCGALVGGDMKEKPPAPLTSPSKAKCIVQISAKPLYTLKHDELSVANVWELGRGRTVHPSERSPSGWNSSHSSLSQ